MRTTFLGLMLLVAFPRALPAQDPQPEFVQEAIPATPRYYAPGPSLSFEGVPMQATSRHPMLFRDPASGRSHVAQPGLLPPAADPNDFQFHPMFDIQSLGLAVEPIVPFARPAGAASNEDTPHIRYGLQLRPGVFYDTGFVNGDTTFNPKNIALDGSAEARLRGQTYFYDLQDADVSVPARLQLDGQSLNSFGLGQGQAYADLVMANDTSVQARSLLFRVLSEGDDAFVIGKAETVFGDLGSAPTLISTGGLPVGSVGLVAGDSGPAFTGVNQVRYTRYRDRWESTLSLEDQRQIAPTDITGTESALNRFPVFAGRLRYGGENGFDSYQIGALIRPIGFTDAAFEDHFEAGYGISGIIRFRNEAATDAVYLGVAGGRGLGSYIYGGTHAALLTADSVNTLSNLGYYASYQHFWYAYPDAVNLSSNFAYGHVIGEPATGTDNRILQQAWANLLWNLNPTTGVGVEYQWGVREVGDGTSGDNHRIMFVVDITPGQGTQNAASSSWQGAVDEATIPGSAVARPAADVSRVSSRRL